MASLVAQEVTNTPPLPPAGIQLGAFGSPQLFIDLGTLVIGTLATAGWKKWGPDISPNLLPFLATFIAIVAGGFATVTIGSGVHSFTDGLKIVALALGNVALRELKDRVKPEQPPTAQPS